MLKLAADDEIDKIFDDVPGFKEQRLAKIKKRAEEAMD